MKQKLTCGGFAKFQSAVINAVAHGASVHTGKLRALTVATGKPRHELPGEEHMT